MATSSLAAWKRRALRDMLASRRETLAFVKRLPRDAIMAPRTQGQWSVKDMLGHFMACDEETVRRFRHLAAGHPERIKWFESMAYADRFNARTVAAARRRGLPAVLRRMAAARREMVRLFQRFPLETLHDPSHDYPVVDWLPAPGWSHEREHLADIKSWWRRGTRA